MGNGNFHGGPCMPAIPPVPSVRPMVASRPFEASTAAISNDRFTSTPAIRLRSRLRGGHTVTLVGGWSRIDARAELLGIHGQTCSIKAYVRSFLGRRSMRRTSATMQKIGAMPSRREAVEALAC